MLTESMREFFPKSRILQIGLGVIFLVLLLNPWLIGGSKALLVAAKICVFILLVASYDLLIGYTGIVSFAHTIFFAFGAYGVAIALSSLGATWAALGLGLLCSVGLSAMFALALGLLSFRVKRIFFAMVTLAIASAVAIFINQNSGITGGEDGLRIKLPKEISPSFKLLNEKIGGVRINGKLISFYLIFATCTALFLVLIRITKSPFGRVLESIRENEFRTNALGYNSRLYVIGSLVIASFFATIAGALIAIANRYINTDMTASLQIMIDILLMVVIGGMGTIYGAVFGVTLVMIAQYYIPSLLNLVNTATVDTPISMFFEHERWLFWLGVIFILCVYFFPQGIAGKLEKRH